MISVTRLDGSEIVLNIDLVQWIEQTPDTVVSLTNGERVIVREKAGEIVQRAIAFRRAVLSGPAIRRDGDADATGC